MVIMQDPFIYLTYRFVNYVLSVVFLDILKEYFKDVLILVI